MHPGWQRLHMLKQLIDRVEVFKVEKPKDWQHWLYVTFDLMNLVVQRNFADVQQLLKEEDIEVDLEPTIADDDTLLKKATEVYRDRLYEWKSENDRPPFTKQDMWIALLQDKNRKKGFSCRSRNWWKYAHAESWKTTGCASAIPASSWPRWSSSAK